MSIAQGTGEDALRSVGHFGSNTRKARYGVTYVRAICSQAGVGFQETSPDEDYLAVDGMVSLSTAPVLVQIKCSSQFKISGRSATWPAEVEWRQKWQSSMIPVYFVLVILDEADPLDWISHHDQGTDHRSGAFWTRVDQADAIGNIEVPKSQRLTVDSLRTWERDVHACFAPATEV